MAEIRRGQGFRKHPYAQDRTPRTTFATEMADTTYDLWFLIEGNNSLCWMSNLPQWW